MVPHWPANTDAFGALAIESAFSHCFDTFFGALESALPSYTIGIEPKKTQRGKKLNYEISREIFAQRLKTPLNFTFIGLNSKKLCFGKKLSSVEHLSYDPENFFSDFQHLKIGPTENVVIFSLKRGDRDPQLASKTLRELGYRWVYYFRGRPSDARLEFI